MSMGDISSPEKIKNHLHFEQSPGSIKSTTNKADSGETSLLADETTKDDYSAAHIQLALVPEESGQISPIEDPSAS